MLGRKVGESHLRGDGITFAAKICRQGQLILSQTDTSYTLKMAS